MKTWYAKYIKIITFAGSLLGVSFAYAYQGPAMSGGTNWVNAPASLPVAATRSRAAAAQLVSGSKVRNSSGFAWP